MASADAIVDERWVGGGEDSEEDAEKTGVRVGSKRKQKRRGKAKVEDANVRPSDTCSRYYMYNWWVGLASLQVGSFWSLHTPSRKRTELSKALVHPGDRDTTKHGLRTEMNSMNGAESSQ